MKVKLVQTFFDNATRHKKGVYEEFPEHLLTILPDSASVEIDGQWKRVGDMDKDARKALGDVKAPKKKPVEQGDAKVAEAKPAKSLL